MSGTSADAIDAAVVMLHDHSLQLLAAQNTPIDTILLDEIRRLMAPQGYDELARCARLDIQLGDTFAQAAGSVIRLAGLTHQEIRAIGSHGQTLRHAPQGASPYSIQIGQPAVIAERTGITTVAHFRQADLAAGGQGAPLAPLFHQAFFSAHGIERAIVNIGGIANISILVTDPQQAAKGFDCGPGNTLMDHHCQQIQGRKFDQDGQWAASGKVDQALLQQLLQDPYFSQPPPKSTGLEYFNFDWLGSYQRASSIQPADLQATLLELTVVSITDALKRYAPQAREVYVCGGGSNNRTLLQRIANRMYPLSVTDTNALGLAPDWVEAAGFAWLACQTLVGHPVNTVPITGAQHAVIAGAVYRV
ncbi:MAG TPA: anhydro-N-acetylmuramic acid kinase [Gammaproteobacteria bacterium]|nr:anhydro-N-acetylmuramic acid kinase [Gammaproteobacteria bacterium]